MPPMAATPPDAPFDSVLAVNVPVELTSTAPVAVMPTWLTSVFTTVDMAAWEIFSWTPTSEAAMPAVLVVKIVAVAAAEINTLAAVRVVSVFESPSTWVVTVPPIVLYTFATPTAPPRPTAILNVAASPDNQAFSLDSTFRSPSALK